MLCHPGCCPDGARPRAVRRVTSGCGPWAPPGTAARRRPGAPPHLTSANNSHHVGEEGQRAHFTHAIAAFRAVSSPKNSNGVGEVGSLAFFTHVVAVVSARQ